MVGKKSLFASLSILVAITTACSGSSNPGTAESSKSPTSTAAATPAATDTMAKTLELSWLGFTGRGKIVDNNKIQQMIEKKFNVKLTNKKIDTNNKEQRNLMVASGELPDYAYYNDDAVKLYRDGVTRSIPKEMIVKYAPKYAALLDKQGTGWKVNQVPGKTGEYFALAGYIDTLENQYWGQAYRLDWMEKLGIKPKGQIVPVGTKDGLERVFYTTQAFTIEEETKMYEAFVNQDPDGNGKKDTYGLLLNNDNTPFTQATTAGAFGFGWGQYLEESGKLTNYAISTGYKDYLKLMADWYKKGIIDPEFTTLNQAKSWEKYGTGKYGGAQVLQFSAAMQAYTHNRPAANIVVKDPTAKILFAPPPIGANGKQGAPAYGAGIDGFGYPAVIRKDVTDEELIRILQIFDYINYDYDGNLAAQFGEEGVDYTWEGTPHKSAIINKIAAEADREAVGIGYYIHVARPAEVTPHWNGEAVMKLNNAFWGTEAGKKTMYRTFRFDYFNETKFNELNTKHSAKLTTITNEYLFKAITGELNVDSTWDNYVKNYLDNGGQELITELAKAPKVSDLRSK